MRDPDLGPILRRTRRRVILRVLARLEPQTASELTLEQALDASRVAFSDREAVRTELTWLEAQGFVEVEDVAGMLYATILDAGVAIANGKRNHPDIEKSPSKRTS